MSISDSHRQEITSALKRCSEKTISAALRFQETRDPADVPVIVYGILERELPEGSAGTLENVPGSSRLVEGIGMDSLGLMEAVMSVEEVLGISIDNSELRTIATLDDLNGFIREKLKTAKVNGSSGAHQGVTTGSQ
jgi:3-hydroxyacyl-[acyl-carrier-protein] dehydratase